MKKYVKNKKLPKKEQKKSNETNYAQAEREGTEVLRIKFHNPAAMPTTWSIMESIRLRKA